MAISCDVCNADVTPSDFNDEVHEYQVINLNGKICLCNDCYCALAWFVNERQDDFKKVVADYRKEVEGG